MNILASYQSVSIEDSFAIFALALGTMKYRPEVSGILIRDENNLTKFHLTDTPLVDLTKKEIDRVVGAIYFSRTGECVATKAHSLRLQWDGEQERRRKREPVNIELSHEDWKTIKREIYDMHERDGRYLISRPLDPALEKLIVNISGKTF